MVEAPYHKIPAKRVDRRALGRLDQAGAPPLLISIILIIKNKIKEYSEEPSALFGLLHVVRESTYYICVGLAC